MYKSTCVSVCAAERGEYIRNEWGNVVRKYDKSPLEMLDIINGLPA